MKKSFYMLFLISLMIFAVLLSSCEEETLQSDEGPMTLVQLEHLEEYVIVRPKNADPFEKVVAIGLRNDLAEKFGVNLEVKTDADAETEKEILIGKTNRAASKDALVDVPTVNSYTIRKNGEKVVICSGSSETLSVAVDKWLLGMVDPDGKLCVPTTTKGYIYKPANAKIDKLTVNGVDITDFSVYTDDSILKIYAQQVADVVYDYTDRKISVAEKMPEKGIVLAFDSENYRTESIRVEGDYIYITPAYGNPKYVIEKLQELFDGAQDRVLDITSNYNSSNTIDYSNVYTKEDLMKLMKTVYESDAVIVGDLADNGKNKNRTLVSSGLEYFKSVTGEYPSMFAIDVASVCDYIRNGGDELVHIAEELTAYAANGGVIQAHSHMSCPTKPHTWREGTLNYSQWDELFVEGSELHKNFIDGLSYSADFFEMLDKNGVPIIWRPYHEINGTWFWWGSGRKYGLENERLDPIYYQKLWKMTYEYFTVERGLDNLIWVYNPHLFGAAETMYSYPGDEYVDMVGIDWYTDGDYFAIENNNCYKELAKTGKIINMCEFGPNGVAKIDRKTDKTGEQKDYFSCRDVLTYMENMRNSKMKTAYWLFWQADQAITGMGYGDEFMQSEYILDLDETNEMLEEIMNERLGK